MRHIILLFLAVLALNAAENSVADLKSQITLMATTFASNDVAVIKQAIATYAQPGPDGAPIDMPDDAVADFIREKKAFLVTVLSSLAAVEPVVTADGLGYSFAIDPTVAVGSKREIVFHYDAVARIFRLQN